MRVQVNTDGDIEGHEKMIDQIRNSVNSALEQTGARITRVEIRLSGVIRRKRGQNSNRCMMKALFVGRKPITVTHQSATLKQAVDCAVDRLSRLIEHSVVDRARHQDGHRTATNLSEPELI